jgi:hypothetical protein
LKTGAAWAGAFAYKSAADDEPTIVSKATEAIKIFFIKAHLFFKLSTVFIAFENGSSASSSSRSRLVFQ